MKKSQESIAIIIPAHNEEKRIERTLKAYLSYFEAPSRKKLKVSILVVVNASTDATLDIVKNYAKKHVMLSALNLSKGGKGYTVLQGFQHALQGSARLIGFVDADLATTPQAYHQLITEINGYDAIIASRYIHGAVVHPKPTLQRIIVSRIFNALIRALLFLPYKDTQCGAKLFKRHALEKVLPSLSLSHWAFDVDMLYNLQKQGFSVRETPTVWSDQVYSTINFMKAGPIMALSIIRLRILNSPFKRFIRIYDTLANIMQWKN